MKLMSHKVQNEEHLYEIDNDIDCWYTYQTRLRLLSTGLDQSRVSDWLDIDWDSHQKYS